MGRRVEGRDDRNDRWGDEDDEDLILAAMEAGSLIFKGNIKSGLRGYRNIDYDLM
jgi:hypothetical protein